MRERARRGWGPGLHVSFITEAGGDSGTAVG